MLYSFELPYSLNLNNSPSRSNRTYSLNSNEIIAFVVHSDSLLFIGTTNGLNYGYYDLEGLHHIENFESVDEMIEGANPARRIWSFGSAR